METQQTVILDHLKRTKRITPLQALSMYGVYRLSDVVLKLRRKGHSIGTTIKRSGKKQFAEYVLCN